MHKYLGDRKVQLTRQVAQDFYDLPFWKGDRELKPHRVSYLEGKLRDGRFHNPKWAIANFEGTTYRMNGKHSSYVLATSAQFPVGLCAVIDEFECKNELDMALLFSEFDNPLSSRNQSEVIGAHLGVHTDLTISKTATLKALAGIVSFRNGGISRRSVSPEERSLLIHDHKEFLNWVASYVTIRRMERPGVVAAMYGTWLRNDEQATEFWQLVKEENHPDNRHPTRVLSSFLRDNTSSHPSSHKVSAQKMWSQRAFFVKAIHAWNAFRKGYTTDLKYHESAELPDIR